MHIDRASKDINYFNISTDQRVKSINPNIDLKKINTNISENKEDINSYSDEDLIDRIERANDDIILYDRKFEFSIHEKTKKISVKVIDTVTDEVIRELPPEKILDMVAGIWEVAGILVDHKI